MPFNAEAGEFFPELGGAPFHKYPVTDWTGSPFFETACQWAAEKFKEIGALSPIKFMADDIIVQVYPTLGRLVFLFQRHINGQDWYVPYEYKLNPPAQAQLRLIGMWPDSVEVLKPEMVNADG